MEINHQLLVNLIKDFPWYYTSDITDADHEAFQGRFGFSHEYVNAERNNLQISFTVFGLIKNSCKKIKIKKIDILQGRSFLSTPTNIPREDVDTPHYDMDSPHFVMLYYVNDSDGDTIIYNEKTIFNDCKQGDEFYNKEKSIA